MIFFITIILLLIALAVIAVYNIDDFTDSRDRKNAEYRNFVNATHQRLTLGKQSSSRRTYS